MEGLVVEEAAVVVVLEVGVGAVVSHGFDERERETEVRGLADEVVLLPMEVFGEESGPGEVGGFLVGRSLEPAGAFDVPELCGALAEDEPMELDILKDTMNW